MLAEGTAMTVAATLATAPLIAFHFGELSTTTLVANLLALPAVAPAMWLGMLAAAAGQVPGFPVEPLNRERAAARLHRPGGELVRAAELGDLEVRLGLGGLVASYLAIALAAVAVPWLARRRRVSSLRRALG